jgi:hypothetical protein
LYPGILESQLFFAAQIVRCFLFSRKHKLQAVGNRIGSLDTISMAGLYCAARQQCQALPANASVHAGTEQ